MDRRSLIMGSTALCFVALGCAGERPPPRHVTGRGALGKDPMYHPTPSSIAFIGGTQGAWLVERITGVRGATLPPVERLAPRAEALPGDSTGRWSLRGVASHVRYVERAEKTHLDASSPPLGRTEATCGALIPIRKSPAWWALAQDERREIFEARSRHIADSMAYLPRIARRLYHSRDLGEPFDFLTWFEFAPEHAAAFDDLLAMLRSREEWRYVEREVEVRLARA